MLLPGAPSWPHAPRHQLSGTGTYLVTAGTYQKTHFFRKSARLDAFQNDLFTVMQEFAWTLEAWAVFSNHYHFIAHCPTGANDATSLSRLLTHLHRRAAMWLNECDESPGRKVWHHYWETQLTYQKSYLARLNYVHQGAGFG
jgi:putative transposase